MTNATPPNLLVVAGALTLEDGRVLLQRRVGGAHAGLWEFPGGKIDPGETPEGALVRELMEELSIVVDPLDCVPAGFASAPLGERHLILLLFLIHRWEGRPVPLVADALAWMQPVEMAVLAMPAADYPLADQLARRAAVEAPCLSIDPATRRS